MIVDTFSTERNLVFKFLSKCKRKEFNTGPRFATVPPDIRFSVWIPTSQKHTHIGEF